MKKLVALIFAFSLMLPNLGLASGNSGWRNIANIKVEGSYFIAVYPTSDFANPDNCGNSSLAVIKLSDVTKDEKLTIALAAYMGGKKIQTYMSGCESTPWGYTVPVMYNLVIGD